MMLTGLTGRSYSFSSFNHWPSGLDPGMSDVVRCATAESFSTRPFICSSIKSFYDHTRPVPG